MPSPTITLSLDDLLPFLIRATVDKSCPGRAMILKLHDQLGAEEFNKHFYVEDPGPAFEPWLWRRREWDTSYVRHVEKKQERDAFHLLQEKIVQELGPIMGMSDKGDQNILHNFINNTVLKFPNGLEGYKILVPATEITLDEWTAGVEYTKLKKQSQINSES